jgi:hypothetical protein
MTIKTLVQTIALGVSLLVAPLLAMAGANEFCESPVIKTWLAERDTAATKLVRIWLGGADEAAVRRAGVELVRWEVLLAPCAPPLRIEDFYVGDAGEPERLPGHVLAVILARQGIDMQAPAFFTGRTFRFRTAPEAAR